MSANAIASGKPARALSTSNLDHALALVREGFHVLPLSEPVGIEVCSCPDGAKCGKKCGKHLRIKGGSDFQNATTDEAQVHAWWTKWPKANIGIVAGREIGSSGKYLYVLDVDSNDDKRGAFSLKALDHLVRAHGGNLIDTRGNKTGSGGVHLYFFTDAPLETVRLKDTYPDIDFQGAYSIVVAPPSVHRKGGIYVADEPTLPIARLPDFVTALILKASATKKNKNEAAVEPIPFADYEDRRIRREEARKYLTEKAPLTLKADGAKGRDKFFQVCVGLAVKMRLPDDEAVEWINEFYKPRHPPEETASWTDEKTIARLKDARNTSGATPGTVKTHAERAEEIAKAAAAVDRVINRNLVTAKTTAAIAELGARVASMPDQPPTASTDSGNAELFVQLHGDRIRYVPAWSSWLIWDGARWQRDEVCKAKELAKDVHRTLAKQAERLDDKERRKWSLKSETRAARLNLLDLAQAEPGVSLSPDAFDADPWLLNVQNGTINLRTGEHRAHDPHDALSKMSEFIYDATAQCPAWLAFLDRVMGGNQEMINFLQRAVGYSLTGDVSEHCFFYLEGGGRNGKSTFVGVIQQLLGEYAKPAVHDLLVNKKNDDHLTVIASLEGARFVTCQEVPEGGGMNTSKAKMLSGGDEIAARGMRQDVDRFKPTHKLWICANHTLNVRDTDEGFWTKIKLVPFSVRIPDAEMNKHLKEELLAERAGILNWAIEGCLAWQKARGLSVPEDVVKATDAYREEEDVMQSFLDDMCKTGPGQTKASELYGEYGKWAQAQGTFKWSLKEFKRRLEAKKFVSTRASDANYWQGLLLVRRIDYSGAPIDIQQQPVAK